MARKCVVFSKVEKNSHGQGRRQIKRGEGGGGELKG